MLDGNGYPTTDRVAAERLGNRTKIEWPPDSLDTLLRSDRDGDGPH